MKIILISTVLMLMAACNKEELRQSVDIVFYNGVVFTAEETDPLYSVVVVDDSRILAVGNTALLARYTSGRMIDLRGRLLMPGFNDVHDHVAGAPRHYIDLSGVGSIEALKTLVKAKAALLGQGEWVTGYGWSEDEMVEGRRPLRSDLDEAAPNNPVILLRAGSHSAAVNSMALERAGINESTPEPAGAIYEKGEDGRLNGILREWFNSVFRLPSPGTLENLRDSLVAQLRGRLALGVTSLTDAWTSPYVFNTQWLDVYARAGDALPRATVQITFNTRSVSADAANKAMHDFGKKTGDGDDRIKVGALKIVLDGGFTGPAAWTIEPYDSDPTYRGLQLVPTDRFYKHMKKAHDEGWQLGIHAIGDQAIKTTVDVMARILDESPRDNHRHYVNHFTILPPVETMKKMAEYDISIVQQPNFTYTLEGRYDAVLDGARLEHNNALRTPMSYGIFMALSSDVLPVDPLVGIYAAVTRKGMSGKVHGADEALTIEEALRGYTKNGAYFTFDEDIKGTIAPGKYADLIILSENLLATDPDDIMNVHVDMTLVGGKILFQREEPR